MKQNSAWNVVRSLIQPTEQNNRNSRVNGGQRQQRKGGGGFEQNLKKNGGGGKQYRADLHIIRGS